MPSQSSIASPEALALLESIVDLIIPATPDGKKPSARDLGIAQTIFSYDGVTDIIDGLQILLAESQVMFGKPFHILGQEAKLELTHALRHKLRKHFLKLSKWVFQEYYQKDSVLNAIGLPARPPFPEGYHVEEGDLSLLEDVYMRGQIYREVDGEACAECPAT